MIYGLPYQESKNQIAENIISILSRGKRFVDFSENFVSHF